MLTGKWALGDQEYIWALCVTGDGAVWKYYLPMSSVLPVLASHAPGPEPHEFFAQA
jgi:hypothetical protein